MAKKKFSVMINKVNRLLSPVPEFTEYSPNDMVLNLFDVTDKGKLTHIL